MDYRAIFIIGFMGSGKSHWGRNWSDKYRLSFIDLDDVIEESFGMTMPEIFKNFGEEKFRELERQSLRNFGEAKNILVACGGGTPCFYDNMEWMLQNGIVIYLNASPQYILRRIVNEIDKRPLLKDLTVGEILTFAEEKILEREQWYNRAHYILDAEELTENTLDLILQNLRAIGNK